MVALDRKTGGQLWRSPRPEMPKGVFGHYDFYHTNLCTLVFHEGVVLLGQTFPAATNLNGWQQKEMILRAIDAASGKLLWDFRGSSLAHFTPPDLFVARGLAWTMRPKDVSLVGLDVRTGKVRKEYPVKNMLVGHHHRCYRNKATERFYLAGEEGIEYIDFKTGELDVHHWLRGACAYGIMPANGCIYLPTHPCGCHANVKLSGFIALTAGAMPPIAPAAKGRLEHGSAYTSNPQSAIRNPQSEDWPIYRRDGRRSNYVPTDVPAKPSKRWSQAVGGRLTQPVIAGGKVFVASRDTDRVVCLDADTGRVLWQADTDGGVDTSPSFHEGRLIFGTRAGSVYALNADDGQLIWRFRAAPADLRLPAFGRLESPWPVHGSVLVIGSKAYCVAGRSMHLNGGMYAYVLDVATGKILQQAQWTADVAPKGELGGAVLPDILVSDGKAITMRTMQLDPDDISRQPAKAGGDFLTAAGGGLADETWFNTSFWRYGKSSAQMFAFDGQAAYGVRAIKKFGTKSYPHDIYTAGTGYRLFAAGLGSAGAAGAAKADRRGKGKPAPAKDRWEQRIAIRAEGLVLTNGHLCVAGAPDVVDEKDPWAAFEDRKGGRLAVFDRQDGKRLCEAQLPSAPIYDGLSAAAGRLYLALKNGAVVCYGQ